MFGLGKKKTGESSDKPAKKSSNKKSSGGSAVWKTWLINHGEKVGLSLFTLFAFYLIYSGLTTRAYERSRTPEVLSSRSLAAKQEIETGKHPIEYPQPNDFRKAVIGARQELDFTPYKFGHIVQKGTPVSGEKRGDPEVFSPLEVQATCFVGSIAFYTEKEKLTSKIDSWFNAPPPGKKRDVPNPSTPPRELNSHFHRGFMYQPGMEPPVPFPAPPPPIPGRLPRTIEYKVGPKLVAFNVVTAVVPHGKMEESYRKELESAVSVFKANRDSPNYLFYEVQRVDVTDNPLRNVDEGEWKEATECMLERQIKERTGWAGFCDEVTASTNLVPNVLTMPIPPILLWDYKSMVTHPLLSTPSSLKADGSGTSYASGTAVGKEISRDEGDDNPGISTALDEELAPLPYQLPSSTYKLIRFFDFGIAPLGKVYRYRVRVALEDPNYPRARSLSVSSSNLKSDVLARIQKLEEEDMAARAIPGQEKIPRNSKRLTEWSEPSRPVFTQRPVEVYANSVRGTWIAAKTATGKDAFVESLAPKSLIVHGEWKIDDAIFVTRKIDVERGSVLSGPLATTEPGLDVIHPITKIIKWLTPYKFTQPITIADLRGGQPLAAEKARPREKDSLPSQGEVVSFDPLTGNLIISREFESVDGYDMFTFAGEASTGGGEGAGDVAL